MAIVRKYLTSSHYTKADNKVVENKVLTDAAKVLYWYMASHRNAFQLNDGLIKVALGWGQDKITRNKRMLKDAGLIFVEKIDRSTYFLYIGSSEMSALKVKDNWDELEKLSDNQEYKPKKIMTTKRIEEPLNGENAFGGI